MPLGDVPQGFPAGGPNFLFLDRVGDIFYLGIASDHWGWGQLLAARDCDLFPKCAQGWLDLAAFRPAGMFPFPVRDASQVKLARDGEGAWYLLGFRSDPNDDPHGTDFADVYGVRFNPFAITPLLYSVHVTFKPGDTGFASTGTHHVEPSGRLLLSSSYRGGPRTRDPGMPATSHGSTSAPPRDRSRPAASQSGASGLCQDPRDAKPACPRYSSWPRSGCPMLARSSQTTGWQRPGNEAP